MSELSKVISAVEAYDRFVEAQMDRGAWPDLKKKLEGVIKSKTRDEWDTIMLGSDVCYAPVLSLEEAPKHPHNLARKTFVEIDGVTQPAPAPRFSRTEPKVQGDLAKRDAKATLTAWGFSASDVDGLTKSGVV